SRHPLCATRALRSSAGGHGFFCTWPPRASRPAGRDPSAEAAPCELHHIEHPARTGAELRRPLRTRVVAATAAPRLASAQRPEFTARTAENRFGRCGLSTSGPAGHHVCVTDIPHAAQVRNHTRWRPGWNTGRTSYAWLLSLTDQPGLRTLVNQYQ